MASKRLTRSRNSLASSNSTKNEATTIYDVDDAQDSSYYGIENEYKSDDPEREEDSSSDASSSSADQWKPSESSVQKSPISRKFPPSSSVYRRKRGRPRKDDLSRAPDSSLAYSDSEPCSSKGPDRPKIRSNKNRKGSNGKMHGGRPAELFRTDLITAMKVNETETFLDMSRCFIISDPWRQDWNNGVQVPVHASSVPEIEFRVLSPEDKWMQRSPDKPGSAKKKSNYLNPKYRRLVKNEFFNTDEHQFASTFKKAEETCRYDLDDLDVRWLKDFNQKLSQKEHDELAENQMERVIERLEMICYDNIRRATLEAGIKTEKQQREDDAACDVCFQDESELDDQIVFCDRCDMAVHQSCYGTGPLPEGTWICRACRISPSVPQKCILCPNRGGALKCSRSGEKWAHVSCVWWIPEVRFENPEMMEPVINIAKVPADRWNLKCVLCRKMEGACIQCSEKACLVAYHVTCAQKHGLYMRMNPTKLEGDLRLESYCPKHHRAIDGEVAAFIPPSPSRKHGTVMQSPVKSLGERRSGSRLGSSLPNSPRKLDHNRRKELEGRFFEFVSADTVASFLKGEVPLNVVNSLFDYWKMKRQSNDNKSLLTPKHEEDKLLKEHEEKEYSRLIKMLIDLRQNLEKARNLCYMVVRARKTEMQYRKVLEEQLDLLITAADRPEISKRDMQTLHKYLEPVPGSLGEYEKLLRGTSIIGTMEEYREGSNSGETYEIPVKPVSGITPLKSGQKSPPVESPLEHSGDDSKSLDVSSESIEILYQQSNKQTNGINSPNSPIRAPQVVVSPKTVAVAEDTELRGHSPRAERDRNYNLSPTMRKAEAAPKNMSWNGELNGLVSATGNRKRKAVSPVLAGHNGLWRKLGSPGSLVSVEGAVTTEKDFYQVRELKRARLRGGRTLQNYSTKLRSKVKEEVSAP